MHSDARFAAPSQEMRCPAPTVSMSALPPTSSHSWRRFASALLLLIVLPVLAVAALVALPVLAVGAAAMGLRKVWALLPAAPQPTGSVNAR